MAELPWMACPTPYVMLRANHYAHVPTNTLLCQGDGSWRQSQEKIIAVVTNARDADG